MRGARDRPSAPISRATCSDAAPSGRLSTTTGARRATSATDGTCVVPAGARSAPSDVVRDDGVAGLARGSRPTRCPCCRDPRSRPFPRQPASRAARAAWIPRRAATPAGAPQYAAIWNNSSSSSASVTPVCGDAARVEHELLHPAERRRHRHHEQAAIAGGERAFARPHAPRHRRHVVLELGRDRVRRRP